MWYSKLRKVLFFSVLGVSLCWFALYSSAVTDSAKRDGAGKPVAQSVAQSKGKLNQKANWQDLFASIDVAKNRVGQGVWRMKKGKLYAYPAAHGARLRIPVVPNGDYELRIKWQPKTDDSSVHFIVPHGKQFACIDILSSFKCAGLGDLNGVRPDINETRTDVKIKGGKIYNVFVRMKYTDKQIYVSTTLNDKKIVDWEGDRAEVNHEFFAPPKPASLGVAVSGNASIIHSMELRMLSGQALPWKGKSESPTTR